MLIMQYFNNIFRQYLLYRAIPQLFDQLFAFSSRLWHGPPYLIPCP